VELLRQGGLVAFPTDTVYGLGCHAFLEAAVRQVFQVKGRSQDQGLPLLLGDVADMRLVAAEVPELAWELVSQFWPGGLTLVLKKSPQVPAIVTGGSDTVAVRLPRHPTPRALCRSLGAPLVGTSANLSGRPSPATYAQVKEQLEGKIDLILRGACKMGVESTILDLTGGRPRMLRHGAVPLEALERVLGVSLAYPSG
jgi:L-threonylcarbamoyladenylate synthase